MLREHMTPSQFEDCYPIKGRRNMKLTRRNFLNRIVYLRNADAHTT